MSQLCCDMLHLNDKVHFGTHLDPCMKCHFRYILCYRNKYMSQLCCDMLHLNDKVHFGTHLDPCMKCHFRYIQCYMNR